MSSLPMHMESDHPIALAESILKVVSSIYGSAGSTPGNPLDPSPPTEDAFKIHKSKLQVQNLCDKLVRTVLGPLQYTILLAESCHESAALRLVTSLRVADIIGDKTVSLSELSEITGVNSQYLSVAMGCLISHGYFVEVGGFGTRRYANNASTEYLKTESPETLRDAIEFTCDDALKASSYLLEAAQASGAGPLEKRLPAYNVAFGFEESIFAWMSSPEQAWRGQRLGRAMQQLHRIANGNIPIDYKWSALSSPIVDVGGGIGSLEMSLMTNSDNEQLRFTIFDIPKTIENAKKVWVAKPPAVASRVSFAAGNFLASSLEETKIPRGQPTYVISHVLHDWTDEQVVAILKNVRSAMLSTAPDSSVAEADRRLILCEMLLHADSSRFVQMTSVQLLALNNGLTRTVSEMSKLVEEAGFKVEKVQDLRAVASIIEARPIS